MRTRTTLSLLVLAASAALPATAQKLAPGLWEMRMNAGGKDMDAAMARAREQMAKMPPDQRKMMEEMMAKQGVSIGGGGAAGIRFCLGKEQAERADVPQDKDGRCKRDSMDRSGSTIRFRFTCTEPPSSGTGEITFSGDKAYAMKMSVTSMVNGQPRTTDMTQNASWLGADCGDLKPRATAGK